MKSTLRFGHYSDYGVEIRENIIGGLQSLHFIRQPVNLKISLVSRDSADIEVRLLGECYHKVSRSDKQWYQDFLLRSKDGRIVLLNFESDAIVVEWE
jgi:hypothetical protein